MKECHEDEEVHLASRWWARREEDETKNVQMSNKNVIMNVHAKIIVVITISIMYPYLYSQKW